MRKIAEGFVLAQGEMVGNTGVVPGSHLNLDKMGAKIDGQYRVEHANHAFSKHGYFVNFKAVRVGKKKPPKPPKHTRSTKDNLVLAYDDGAAVDPAADSEREKKKAVHKPRSKS